MICNYGFPTLRGKFHSNYQGSISYQYVSIPDCKDEENNFNDNYIIIAIRKF
jgi:hypothetical protein